jgi:signal transduction histidine kinase/CheY-like chemotaxis protein/HAMP domain-containing protein
MNRYFNHLPLQRKLMLIAIIPLACLIFFGIQIFNKQSEEISTVNRLMVQIERSTAIMRLADALHTERRASVNYLLQTGNIDMLLERAKTDGALEALKPKIQLEEDNFFKYAMLDLLAQKRMDINNKTISQKDVIDYYSQLILRLNALSLPPTPDIPVLKRINQDMNGQNLLTQMATYLGMMRMNYYYMLLRKDISEDDFSRLDNNYELYQALAGEFLDKASPAAVEAYKKFEQGEEFNTTISVISKTIQTGKIDTTRNAETWWGVSALGVDQLKRLQRQLIEKVNNDAKTIFKEETDLKTRYFVFLVLIVAAVIFIVFYTIRNITESLSTLRQAAGKIASGATDVKINIHSKDAIGSLARSFSEITHNNKVLADAADAIGRGNFNIAVSPRSSQDILGTAIVQMKDDLRLLRAANDTKIWIQTGITKISETLLGDQDMASLGHSVLQDLVHYTGAQIAVMYTKNQEVLQFLAGYALSEKYPAPETILIGQTLLGQAALERKPLYLKDIPNDFLHITSSAGQAAPAHIIIVPLIHAGIVEGVIEIGAFQPFPEGIIDFTEQVGSNIAVAIQSTKSRVRLQELLEETQSQAEELQAQHSELEGLNTELEAQTQKLQVSEEELKVQQEELMQSNTELEERSRLLEEKNQVIVERNLDIQRKAEELALSTRYKSEFLANMSHELRTPLNSILLLSRLLSENHEKNLSADQIEYSQVIQSSGKGLLTLIDEILDLSKIESGKMELEYMPVSLSAVISNMQSLFEPIAREKGLTLQTQVSPQVPGSIETDQSRLEQVLKNLLSNALKFTAKGQVTLQVTPGQTPQTIHFIVKDTGIGIPEEKQQVIFEAFQQADGSTRRKYGGTGLGLSISRELVKLLGGQILLNSEPGSGSEFVVTIPIVAKQPAPIETAVVPTPILTAPVESKAAAMDPSPARYLATAIPEDVTDDRGFISKGDPVILIVEDDTYFAKALLDFTRARGYKGVVTVRGDLALDLAKQYKPVGILLDIMLPIKDGWQVMEELKNDAQTRPIPVHIMSSMEMKKESLLKGAVDFINKPVAIENMQLIFEKLEFVLNKSSKKVLIVEENAKHAKALSYFLSTYQVNSEISNNVQEGVSLLQQKDVDCVILDMGIPDQQAYETLEAVKKIQGLEQLPIIIFTGKSLSKAEEQRIKQYADSIVVKTAHSYQRILDEVSLFLHLVEERNHSSSHTNGKMSILNEVLRDKVVLVADDDVRNIFSLTKSLEAHQMKVISAIDGKEALQQLTEHPNVDIVLMDMMMPEMDGYETIAQIRQERTFKTLPIIAVTAKAMMGDREKCIQAGASDYISKPVDVDQLLSLLRVWLYDRAIK